MAGVKGKSGGARPNSGGARPGAGRKPKPPPSPVPQPEKDMLQLLQDIARGLTDATPLQVRAAVAAVQYTHTKKGDGGVKDERADRAKKAATGRFGADAPPLKLVGNR
jgi:phage terminase small subunit